MHAEPAMPAVVEVFGLIVAALAELWFLCCIWDALRKGQLDFYFREGVRRRDDPVLFWGCFVWVVFMAIFVALCFFLYFSQSLQ